MAQRLPVGTTGTRGQPVKATVPFQLRVAHSNNTSREPSSSSSSSSCLLLLTGTAGETACTVTPQRETSPAPSHKLTSRHHSNESTSLPASPFSIPPSISPAHPTLLLSSSPQTSSWSSSAGAPPGPSQLEPTRSITTTPAYKEIPSQPTAVPSCSSPSRTSVPRTFSLDTLAGPYLLGHWPRDGNHAHCAPCMRDKATQTPKAWADECSEKRRSSHKRSASWGSTDQLKEIAKLRQQLQRSKHSSRRHRDKERKSPFNGNHVVIGQSQTPVTKTYLIPVPKSTGSRFRNSVEGLNQEIERIIIRDPGERDEQLVPQDVPDGHRAPPPLTQRSSSTRSIDTQTPSSGGGGGGNHSNNSSRPDSISPSFLTVANSFGGHSPFNGEDLLSDGRTSTHKDLDHNSPIPKYAFSPKPNNSYTFKREPPEGCEKVKACEDLLPRPTRDVPQFLCPDRNKVNFIPKSGSAFCLVSILKPLLPTQELSFRGSLSPTLEQEQEQWVSRGTCTSTPQPCLPLHLEEPEG